jgi:ABC-2 type transport system permease protein
MSAASAMAYRADFIIEGAMAVAWMGLTLLPLIVLFQGRSTVADWTAADALVVIAFFMALRAILEGMISPSIVALVEEIRSGAFDYILLKPVDAQFMVSASRYEPWKIFDLLGAIGLVIYAFIQRGEGPPPASQIVLGIVMLGLGVLAMYSLWIIAAAVAFWVVRLDNLSYLLGAVFDTARWPVQVFRGLWRVVFTFVIPVAVMTTFPAMALLGTLESRAMLAIAAGVVAMLAISRLVWRSAIRNYTSASS